MEWIIDIRHVLLNITKPRLTLLLSVPLSTALYFTLSAAYLANDYGIFPQQKMVEGAVIIPGLFLIMAPILGRFLALPEGSLLSKDSRLLLVTSLVLSIVLSALFPPPMPAFPQAHRLYITTTGEKNEASTGANIEIRKLNYMDGTRIVLEEIDLSGDWQVIDDKLASKGEPASTARLEGIMPGGVVISLAHNGGSGVVEISWDGDSRQYDLYAGQDGVSKIVFKGVAWGSLSLFHTLIRFILLSFYLLGLASVPFLAGAAIRYRLLDARFMSLVLLLSYFTVFILFLRIKITYASFNEETFFRDTYSYVTAAEKPLLSSEFWAGERSFTVPLLYKALGIHTDNYKVPAAMQRVAVFQSWFSIVCWLVLAAVMARNMRQRWSGLLVFSVVLFFSLCLEISLWDPLLLSESISFSLQALLVAAWIFWGSGVVKRSAPAIVTVYLVGLSLLSVLYSFVRDSNVYFLVVVAGVFACSAIIGKVRGGLRLHFLVYMAAILALFFLQNLSINHGNRWQILIYDHLAMRILPDPLARAYFAAAGLPINPELMQVTGMRGAVYQQYMLNDPQMSPVRHWVNEKGRPTYLSYLLSEPLRSFLEPLLKVDQLLNGSFLQYRFPRYMDQPVPPRIQVLSAFFYPRFPDPALAVLVIVSLVISIYWLFARPYQPVGLVLSALVISIYPLMFVSWHGNPMEIERHAAQAAIQLRLAGWVALAIVVDRVTSTQRLRTWFERSVTRFTEVR